MLPDFIYPNRGQMGHCSLRPLRLKKKSSPQRTQGAQRNNERHTQYAGEFRPGRYESANLCPPLKNPSCLVSFFSLFFRQMRIAFLLLSALLMCFCLTGCKALQKFFGPKDITPPQEFTAVAQPTLEQITSAINRNSQQIRNFTTPNASITVPGAPLPLHSQLTFERPKRLRMQGSASSLSGQEFDFGSNDQLFWLWMKRSSPKEMWYCRHDQYPISPVRSAIPIDPDWLIEALGIVEFKPTDQHYGPTRGGDGNWEIISHCQTPSGQYIKRTVIDSKIGWIVRQELYTPQNELVASSEAKDSKFDPGTGIYYAKRIEVRCQGMNGNMTIDLGSPSFNTSASLPSSQFVMPTYDGYQVVDLCGPEILQRSRVVMPPQTPMPNVPEASMQTVIR